MSQRNPCGVGGPVDVEGLGEPQPIIEKLSEQVIPLKWRAQEPMRFVSWLPKEAGILSD
jgi:hypothetical protein